MTNKEEQIDLWMEIAEHIDGTINNYNFLCLKLVEVTNKNLQAEAIKSLMLFYPVQFNGSYIYVWWAGYSRSYVWWTKSSYKHYYTIAETNEQRIYACLFIIAMLELED